MKKILMALMLCLVSICGFGQFYGPCPGNETVTDVEGNVYNTIQIGNTCWMRENLRTGLNNEYESISRRILTQYNDESAVVYVQNEQNNINHKYCPEGWKLPSSFDFVNIFYQVQYDGLLDTFSFLQVITNESCAYGNNLSGFDLRMFQWNGNVYYDRTQMWALNDNILKTIRIGDWDSTDSNFNGIYITNGTYGNIDACCIRCIKDTTYTPEVTQPDTIYIHDTITITDTITIHDTVWVTDTLWLHDTITVTDTIYIYTDTTNTGIHEWGKTIKAYPNPTTGKLYLEGDFRQVSVWDMNGKCLQVTDEKILNFETMSSGVYILRIVTLEGNVVVKKIIKQ